MEYNIFDREYFELRYNCSFYSVDSIPLKQRRHPIIGASFIFLFLVTEALYIPCMFAIWKHLEQSSYKIMFFLGIIDVIGLWMSGFFTGYFGITGAVYCSHPRLIYILGLIGKFCWGNESGTALMLALNRCIEVLSPHWSAKLFKGNRCWFWLAFPLSYGFYFAIFTKPIFANSIFMSWFFNPHAPYFDDPEGTNEIEAMSVWHRWIARYVYFLTYVNWTNTIYNWFVVIALPGLYITFIVLFALKSYKMRRLMQRSRWNKAETKSFIQVLIITTANVMTSAIFDYMNIFEISPFVIYVAQYAWYSAHAVPPFIYLTLNKTIRLECLRMFKNLFGMRSNIISTITAKISHLNTATGQDDTARAEEGAQT